MVHVQLLSTKIWNSPDVLHNQEMYCYRLPVKLCIYINKQTSLDSNSQTKNCNQLMSVLLLHLVIILLDESLLDFNSAEDMNFAAAVASGHDGLCRVQCNNGHHSRQVVCVLHLPDEHSRAAVYLDLQNQYTRDKVEVGLFSVPSTRENWEPTINSQYIASGTFVSKKKRPAIKFVYRMQKII